MDTITAPSRPRIAVIAVHGVADQKPSDTVRTAAKLLAGTAGGYGAFDEQSLRISVERVPTDGQAAAPGMLKEVLGYKVQSKTVADQVNPATPGRNGDVSLEYMEELLKPYQVDDEDVIYLVLDGNLAQVHHVILADDVHVAPVENLERGPLRDNSRVFHRLALR